MACNQLDESLRVHGLTPTSEDTKPKTMARWMGWRDGIGRSSWMPGPESVRASVRASVPEEAGEFSWAKPSLAARTPARAAPAPRHQRAKHARGPPRNTSPRFNTRPNTAQVRTGVHRPDTQ